MNDDSSLETKLVGLRVGIARVAQAAGIGNEVPGCGDQPQAPFEILCKVVREEDVGWHALLSHLLDIVRDRLS